jgi:ABC-type uncharacterized transport system ATPase component
MNDFLTVVINPEGRKETMTIAEAILLIEERDGRYTYAYLDKEKRKLTEKRRRENRERYLKMKNDPVKYKEYLEQKRLSRCVYPKPKGKLRR